ncbi:hypothetical protein NDN01_20215 [Sphingomonas sp. QA11]|uniref:hypothetical protein n=1 Tax=Sphingomonas sp. QA11 TaxID=2950605 RepID=UPI00234B63EA|nr:hypothetical protein [Sphingomonas sp. QA11]WCM26306.1 hypothetical protein NDN01_20215 [Sphingomonas sp. QA11]
MTNQDRAYYERRRAASLANAERVRTPMIAKIHRDFAAHYATMLAARRDTT